MPIKTPLLAAKSHGVGAYAMPTRPRPYTTAPATITRSAPNRSATMPAKTPATPQEMFCIAIANENVSRVHPRAWVTGSSHSPKPWRIPIDNVTMAAPHTSTWVIESVLFAEFMGKM